MKPTLQEERERLASYIADLIKAYEYAKAKGSADVDNKAFSLSNEIDRALEHLMSLIR